MAKMRCNNDHHVPIGTTSIAVIFKSKADTYLRAWLQGGDFSLFRFAFSFFFYLFTNAIAMHLMVLQTRKKRKNGSEKAKNQCRVARRLRFEI